MISLNTLLTKYLESDTSVDSRALLDDGGRECNACSPVRFRENIRSPDTDCRTT